MKLKRTSLKVLLSASIILSMIPFSFNQTYADYTYPDNTGSIVTNYVFSFERLPGSNNIKMMVDYYLICDQLLNTNLVVEINRNYTMPGLSNAYSFALIDSDGVESIQTEYQTSGTNAIRYAFWLKLKNCSYVHYRFTMSSDTYWTDTNMMNVSQRAGCTMHYGNNAPPANGSYKDYYNNTVVSYTGITVNNSFYLKQILNELKNGIGGGTITVDLSSVENLIQDVLTVMDIQLGQQYETNQKLDIIINQLNTQQGTPAQDSIDDNTQANEDLQTESSTYEQLESQFNDDFTDNLENVPTQTLEDHLQTWSTGVTWFRTQMDNIYNNLGEFKYITSIAIVLAIALIFIGR